MKKHLGQLIREHADGFIEYVDGARRGHGQSMHQARVVSRRLREALAVAVIAVPDGEAARMAGRVRRAASLLGKVRELNVAIEALDDDASVHRWGAVATLRVREHLVKARDRAEASMRSKLDRLGLDRVPERLDRLEAAIDRAGTRAWHLALSTRIRKRAKRFDRALRHVGTLYAPASLHDVRIACKKLRYALELAGTSTAAPTARHVRRLKALQDRLGQLHDLHVLQEHVRRIAAVGSGDMALRTGLEQICADLETDARALHAAFLGDVDRALGVAARAKDIAAALVPKRPLRVTRPRPISGRGDNRSAVA